MNLADFGERRFAGRLKCQQCVGKAKNNGTNKDKVGIWRLRYLCNDCGKAFSDFTGTPNDGVRWPDLWTAMAKQLHEARSIPKTTKAPAISNGTAFRWHHKLSGPHRDGKKPVLTEIVEADETHFRKSREGSRKLVSRSAITLGNRRAIANLGKELVREVYFQWNAYPSETATQPRFARAGEGTSFLRIGTLNRRPHRHGGGISSLHGMPETESVGKVVSQDRKGQAATRNAGIGDPKRQPIRGRLGAVVDRSARKLPARRPS